MSDRINACFCGDPYCHGCTRDRARLEPSEAFLSGYNAGRYNGMNHNAYDVGEAWRTFLRHGGRRSEAAQPGTLKVTVLDLAEEYEPRSAEVPLSETPCALAERLVMLVGRRTAIDLCAIAPSVVEESRRERGPNPLIEHMKSMSPEEQRTMNELADLDEKEAARNASVTGDEGPCVTCDGTGKGPTITTYARLDVDGTAVPKARLVARVPAPDPTDRADEDARDASGKRVRGRRRCTGGS